MTHERVKESFKSWLIIARYPDFTATDPCKKERQRMHIFFLTRDFRSKSLARIVKFWHAFRMAIQMY